MTDQAALEAYLRRCLDFFDEVRGLVPDLDLRDAESLLNHGEPAEGISDLAWALASAENELPPHLVETIRELTAGWVADDELPAQFPPARVTHSGRSVRSGPARRMSPLPSVMEVARTRVSPMVRDETSWYTRGVVVFISRPESA